MPVIFSAFAGWLASALGMAVGTTVMGLLAIVFSDVILGFVGQAINLLVAGVEATGVELPSLSTSVAALPSEVILVMKRLRFDDAMSLLVTAVTVRGASSMFGFIRGLRSGA